MLEISDRIIRLNYSCRCGCGLKEINPVSLEVVQDALEYFEEVYRRPLKIKIHSACRCVEHNEAVQKEANSDYVPYSSRSRHLPDFNNLCHAIDFHIAEVSAYYIYKYLDEMYPDCLGLGKYSWGIHVDPRPIRKRW